MCMGTPRQVTAIVDPGHGIVEVEADGRRKRVSAAVLLTEGQQIEVGDWVDVHLGFALEKLTVEEAEEARRWLDEMLSAQKAAFGLPDE